MEQCGVICPGIDFSEDGLEQCIVDGRIEVALDDEDNEEDLEGRELSQLFLLSILEATCLFAFCSLYLLPLYGLLCNLTGSQFSSLLTKLFLPIDGLLIFRLS